MYRNTENVTMDVNELTWPSTIVVLSHEFTLPNTETEADKWLSQNCVDVFILVQRQITTQTSNGSCVLVISVCPGLVPGQCECTIRVYSHWVSAPSLLSSLLLLSVNVSLKCIFPSVMAHLHTQRQELDPCLKNGNSSHLGIGMHLFCVQCEYFFIVPL